MQAAFCLGNDITKMKITFSYSDGYKKMELFLSRVSEMLNLATKFFKGDIYLHTLVSWQEDRIIMKFHCL